MHSQPEERRKKIEDLRKNLLKPVASKKTGPAHVASVNVGSTDTARPIAAAVKRMAPRPVAATSGTAPLFAGEPGFCAKTCALGKYLAAVCERCSLRPAKGQGP